MIEGTLNDRYLRFHPLPKHQSGDKHNPKAGLVILSLCQAGCTTCVISGNRLFWPRRRATAFSCPPVHSGGAWPELVLARWNLLHSWRMMTMGQSFGNEITLVEVVTDNSETQLWVAAAKPDQAVSLVLHAIPEGWTATIIGVRLTSEQEATLNLQPGEVRELKK
jgi:hypothetical protein